MAESPGIIDGLGLEELKSLLVQVLEDNARLKARTQSIRFWDYLGARLAVPGAASVPMLPDIIRSG